MKVLKIQVSMKIKVQRRNLLKTKNKKISKANFQIRKTYQDNGYFNLYN